MKIKLLTLLAMLAASALALAACGSDEVAVPAVEPGAACIPEGMTEDEVARVLEADGVEVSSDGGATSAFIALDNFLVPSANARGGGGGGGGRSSGSRSSSSSSRGSSSSSRPAVKTQSGKTYSKYSKSSSKHKPGSYYARNGAYGTYYSHYGNNLFSSPFVWFYVGALVADDDDVNKYSQNAELTCMSNEDHND